MYSKKKKLSVSVNGGGNNKGNLFALKNELINVECMIAKGDAGEIEIG